MADPPEVPDAPPERDPDLQPATQGELRSLRRWLLVTAVWAVAATAVALIALLSEDDERGEGVAGPSREQVTQLERDVNARLDTIEEDTPSLAQQEDVTKLAQRLSRVEDDASKAANDVKDIKSQDRRPRDPDRGPRVERRHRRDHGRRRPTAATRALNARGAPRRTPLAID